MPTETISLLAQIPVVGIFALVVFRMMSENRLYLESRDKHIGETHKAMAEAITALTKVMQDVDKNITVLITRRRYSHHETEQG